VASICRDARRYVMDRCRRYLGLHTYMRDVGRRHRLILVRIVGLMAVAWLRHLLDKTWATTATL